MRPEDVDVSRGERISFASSAGPDRERWTELEVYHFEQAPAPKRHWMSVRRGCSSVPGERTRESRLLVGSLERALKLFDESTELGVIAAEQARDWAEQAGAGDGDRPALASDVDALAWLYGVPVDRLPSVNSMAADLGLGESTLRMALKNGSGAKVPLVAIAPFVDRDAFVRAKLGEPADV